MDKTKMEYIRYYDEKEKKYDMKAVEVPNHARVELSMLWNRLNRYEEHKLDEYDKGGKLWQL